MNWKDIEDIVRSGGIGVVPTDTIYGLIGSARAREAVERIYAVRKRDKNKPLIVLISSIDTIKEFGIFPTESEYEILRDAWSSQQERKTSVILCIKNRDDIHKWRYIHRDTGCIAFRLVHDGPLADLIHATGPIVAPSANIQGAPPAQTTEEAQGYFGDSIDFYISDHRQKTGCASRIIKLRDGIVTTIR